MTPSRAPQAKRILHFGFLPAIFPRIYLVYLLLCPPPLSLLSIRILHTYAPSEDTIGKISLRIER